MIEVEIWSTVWHGQGTSWHWGFAVMFVSGLGEGNSQKC